MTTLIIDATPGNLHSAEKAFQKMAAETDGGPVIVGSDPDAVARADRLVLPGDGILPLREGIQAIRATGYDDLWCVEMMGAYHWEWDPFLLAGEVRGRAEALLRE